MWAPKRRALRELPEGKNAPVSSTVFVTTQEEVCPAAFRTKYARALFVPVESKLTANSPIISEMLTDARFLGDFEANTLRAPFSEPADMLQSETFRLRDR